MKVIDLTHTIRENMPVYPGTEPPKLSPTSSYESDGFKETLLQMYTHTGTHRILRHIFFRGEPRWMNFRWISSSGGRWSSTAEQ